MASLLYRIGAFSARHRWVVLGVWTLLIAALAVAALGMKSSSTAPATLEIPGTDSSKGISVIQDKFGDAGDDATGTVVLQAPTGQSLTGANATAVAAALDMVRAIPGVASVSDPLAADSHQLSKDGRTAAASVTFDTVADDVTQSTRDAFTTATDRSIPTASGSIRVEAVSDLDVGGSSITAEIIGIAVAFLILILTYGTLVAAGANMLTAAVGVGVGLLGITVVGKLTELSSTTPALASMLGLAVGIDYALFVFARTRAELRAGRPVQAAVAHAVGTAGTAVAFAGATVIIALVGLSVAQIPFLTEMGVAAAATVAVAVLVALTAVPAVLSLLGSRLLRKNERASWRARQDHDDNEVPSTPAHSSLRTRTPDRFFGTWSRRVTAHPVIALLLAVAVVGTVAIPTASMRTALPSAENGDPASSSRQAYDMLAEGFGAGSQATLTVVVTARSGADAEGVAAAAATVTTRIEGLQGVAAIAPAVMSPDGTAQLVTVVPTTGPTDVATADLVRAVRAAINSPVGDADVLVTGQTALDIDTTSSLNDALPVYLVLIVVLALLLLVLLFRSILVPLLATVGFLFSLGASLGATVAVHQWGWLSDVFGVMQPAPLLSFMPVIVVGILFGLAMDYQMFLVSAMHEAHSRGASARQAVKDGFARSAPVVVTAALIMMGVFLGFAFSGDSTIGTIGLALSIGILVDALIVRMVIMPAALTLLGEKAWWLPRWMQRIVPNIDAEGRGLEAQPTVPTIGTPESQDDASDTDDVPSVPASQTNEASITGKVVDASGSPLPGATLTLTDQAGVQAGRTTTAADGAFVVPLNVRGTFVLIAAAEGSAPSATLVVIGDGPVHHTVILVGTASVHVRVSEGMKTAASAPVPAALLSLVDARGGLVGTGHTGPDGVHVFSGLRSGPYVVSALSDGYRPEARAVTVQDQESVEVGLVLTRGSRLSGRVLLAGGARAIPVPGATVTVTAADGVLVDQSQTDASGRFGVESLGGGDYRVTAAGPAPLLRSVRVDAGVDANLDLVLGAMGNAALPDQRRGATDGAQQ